MENKFTDEVYNFLKENYAKMGGKFCLKHLGPDFAVESVQNFCIQNNLIKPDLEKAHPFDLSKFQIITQPNVAYYLGMLWGDGHVRHGLVILINTFLDGVKIYEDIKEVCDFNIRIRKARGTSKDIFVASVCSVIFSQFLLDLDYGKKSIVTPHKVLDKIPKHLHRFFWLGFMDADGCIYTYTEKNEKQHVKAELGFSGSYNQCWDCLLKFLDDLGCPGKVKRIIDNRGSKNSHVKVLSKYDIIRVLSVLYKTYDLDKIGLHRKHEKYLEVKLLSQRKSIGIVPFYGVSRFEDIYIIGVTKLDGKHFSSKHVTLEAAVLAYDQAAVKFRGHRARTNNPITDYLDISFHEDYAPN